MLTHHVTRHAVAGIALAAAVALGLPFPAHAFDMTGLWVGSVACKGFNGVKTKSSVKDINMFVTHDPNDRSVVLTVNGNTYLGATIDDVTRPERGELAVANCGSDDDLITVGPSDEVGRFSVSTKLDKPAATLKGTTIVSRGNVFEFQSCKWSFKRRDRTEPGLIGCP